MTNINDSTELLDFIKDPKNIAKAVEGSMEKRLKAMNDSTEQIRNIVGEAIKADPNYLEFLELTGAQGIYDIESRIVSGIQEKIDQTYTKGREEGYKKGYIHAGLEQVNKGVNNG